MTPGWFRLKFMASWLKLVQFLLCFLMDMPALLTIIILHSFFRVLKACFVVLHQVLLCYI